MGKARSRQCHQAAQPRSGAAISRLAPASEASSSGVFSRLYGIHFSVRHGDKADTTMILVALGVDLAGNTEVLAALACAEEGKAGWVSVLEDLSARGATQLELIVTDGHDGVLAAVAHLFSATPRPRCLVQKQRNVLPRCPQAGAKGALRPNCKGSGPSPPKREPSPNWLRALAKDGQLSPEAVRSLTEDEEHTLIFYQVPESMHRSIRTTTAIESLWSLVRQRTDQIDAFTTQMSCLTIVWATIAGLRLRKVPVEETACQQGKGQRTRTHESRTSLKAG